jgi:hypothetical protein
MSVPPTLESMMKLAPAVDLVETLKTRLCTPSVPCIELSRWKSASEVPAVWGAKGLLETDGGKADVEAHDDNDEGHVLPLGLLGRLVLDAAEGAEEGGAQQIAQQVMIWVDMHHKAELR